MPEHNHPITLAQALRSLPLEAPPRSAWPRLSRSLEARARPRRPWPLLAAAACLALAALWLPRLAPEQGMPAQALAGAQALDGAQAPADPLQALAGESAALEALLADAGDPVAAGGPTAAVRAAVTRRLQVVDALLADPATDRAAELPLWQVRVVLMRQLVGLSRGEELIAAAGDVGDGTLVMTF